METIEEIKTEEIIINAEPEFVEGYNEKLSAQYFVLCEDSEAKGLDKNIYEYKICGVTLLNWVQRACESRPVVLRVTDEDEVISLIRPYLAGADYSVVLFANTPLVAKDHIRDLLGYAERKHMNVLKLTKGYVFRNEFIEKADEFYSIDTYNFASNDLFEVKNLSDLELAKVELKDRMFKFYENSGVCFENKNTVSVDATAQIEYSTTIMNGSSVLGSSKLGINCKIKSNATIVGSKLGDDVEIGEGAIVEGSVIKNGAKIGAGAIIKGSVIGENSVVQTGSKIIRSGLKENVVIGDCSTIIDSKLEESVETESAVSLLKCNAGSGVVVKLGQTIVSKTIKSNNSSEEDKD